MPCLLFDGGVKPIKVSEVGHVALHSGDIAADLLHCLVEFALTTPGNKYLRALRHKTLCGGQADASCTSRNDGYFSFEFPHDIAPFGSPALVVYRTIQMCREWPETHNYLPSGMKSAS